MSRSEIGDRTTRYNVRKLCAVLTISNKIVITSAHVQLELRMPHRGGGGAGRGEHSSFREACQLSPEFTSKAIGDSHFG